MEIDATRTGGGPEEHAGPGEPEDPEIEPIASGTLFIMIVFLMALAGMWGIMFLHLLER